VLGYSGRTSPTRRARSVSIAVSSWSRCRPAGSARTPTRSACSFDCRILHFRQGIGPPRLHIASQPHLHPQLRDPHPCQRLPGRRRSLRQLPPASRRDFGRHQQTQRNITAAAARSKAVRAASGELPIAGAICAHPWESGHPRTDKKIKNEDFHADRHGVGGVPLHIRRSPSATAESKKNHTCADDEIAFHQAPQRIGSL